jgi:hypothetical protein
MLWTNFKRSCITTKYYINKSTLAGFGARVAHSQPQVIKFTSCLPMVSGSLRVLRLLAPLKLVAMI